MKAKIAKEKCGDETFGCALDWINGQEAFFVELLKEWSMINSFSDNMPGLAAMHDVLKSYCERLNAKARSVDLKERYRIDAKGSLIAMPHGQALHLVKHEEAKIQILLVGHMDTVYPPASKDSPQEVIPKLNNGRLIGPGVADMKGGLIVMLTALEALERSPYAGKVGWQVIINPDEEVGSVGSIELIESAAKKADFGLVFEPAFSDGAIVSSRKGSLNMTVSSYGKSAHAGRDFDKGRNAIEALAHFILEASTLSCPAKDVTINIAEVMGGSALNVVPDYALCRLNMRACEHEDFDLVACRLTELGQKSYVEGTHLKLHLHNRRPPKPFTESSKELFSHYEACAKEEGLILTSRPSGGVCDGNILAENGLAVLDSLGVVGGDLHTAQEYMFVDSLVQRSRMAARLLMGFACGRFSLPASLQSKAREIALRQKWTSPRSMMS